MKKAKLTERFTAIITLQKKQKQYESSSYWFNIYEKATDLALNPKRKVDEFFMRNLIRDAKRILSRQKKNSIFKEISTEDSDSDTGTIVFEDFLVNEISPEHQLIYSNYIEQIKETCPAIHEYAVTVFEGMMEGKSSVVIAKEIGVSESLVKKIRLKVRSIAEAIVLN
jgi:hypothetical protein